MTALCPSSGLNCSYALSSPSVCPSLLLSFPPCTSLQLIYSGYCKGNCSTACFQEGLSQLSNSTVSTRFRLTLNQVKRIVVALKSNKCGSFACEQPCNRTTTGNTVTFLKTLLESFQNENMRGKV
nr:interleukin-9 isoform X1 [Ovis aries]